MQLTHEELRILDHIQVCLTLQADFTLRSEEGNSPKETLLPASPCFESDSTYAQTSMQQKPHLPIAIAYPTHISPIKYKPIV